MADSLSSFVMHLNILYLSPPPPTVPRSAHGGNEASYASYQRMVGKRLPQLHFLDFKRLRPDPSRASPTLSRSALAMARIKSLRSGKSPLFNSPVSLAR